MVVMSRPAAFLCFALAAGAMLPSAAVAQDAGEGERLFRQRCASCHTLQPGQNRTGPQLAGVMGRRAGSVEGARYSNGMQGSNIVWDEQSLDGFLANPRQVVPGTSMGVSLPDKDQRQAVIAYLKTIAGPAN